MAETQLTSDLIVQLFEQRQLDTQKIGLAFELDTEDMFPWHTWCSLGRHLCAAGQWLRNIAPDRFRTFY